MPNPDRAPHLAAAFHHQDRVFSRAFSILATAIHDHVFPAVSIAVVRGGNVVALKALGNLVYPEDLRGSSPRLGEAEFPSGPSQIDSETLFDLASVTKVVATTTMAMMLYERGLLALEAPLAETLPEFLVDAGGARDARRREVSFRMLLAHSSGLPAYEKLFLRASSRDQLLRAAFTLPLSSDPGTHAEYSDIGFILLGTALERLAQEPLDGFCQREIFAPLGMADTTFHPPRQRRSQIPPTADERTEGGTPIFLATPATAGSQPDARRPWRNRVVQGEVQDENAFVLGGVAGHAGLFSTAKDMARFAQMMVEGGTPLLRPETVTLFTRRESLPPGTSRALGWDTPSSPSQSGEYFGRLSFGHLGYTGTSLWIDPDRRLSIVMLSNRTWPDRANQAIQQIRPKFHDAVVEALD
jgi:serine-type D-Ala-D-Ala carboxypeptidase